MAAKAGLTCKERVFYQPVPIPFSGIGLEQGLLEKWVKSSLLSDGGGRTVAGEDPDVVTQHKQTGAYAGNQLLIIAAGKSVRRWSRRTRCLRQKGLWGCKGKCSQGMTGVWITSR